jgi:hypothetical protein
VTPYHSVQLRLAAWAVAWPALKAAFIALSREVEASVAAQRLELGITGAPMQNMKYLIICHGNCDNNLESLCKMNRD